jgi:Leucine-rich repeat (LRR) protein
MSSNSNVPNSLRSLGITRLDIRELDLGFRDLESLPKEISKLKYLEDLFLTNNKLTSLPKEIGSLKNLRHLSLGANKLTSLPKEIGKLKNLSFLDLSYNKLTSLPKETSNFKNLWFISLYSNNLTSFPKDIINLKNLRHLNLGINKLSSIPKEIGNLKKIDVLNLSGNNLTSIPKEIGNIRELMHLFLFNNKLTSLPKEIINLKNLNKLYLTDNPNLKYINRSLYREGLVITKNFSTKIYPPNPPIQKIRRNVYLNKNNYNHKDHIAFTNFNVGNNAVKIGTKYYLEDTLLKLAKKFNNINHVYKSDPTKKILRDPYTRQNVLRKNLTFVKFVKPKSPNNSNAIRKKSGNAAQSRRTNRN